LAAESGLSDKVMEALPPDAPKGHECYRKVGWRETQGIAVFQFPDATGAKVNFQTTINAACGSKYAASRIARSCYLQFEKHESKDSVLAFRAACYARMQEADASEHGKPRITSTPKVKGGVVSRRVKRRKIATPSGNPELGTEITIPDSPDEAMSDEESRGDTKTSALKACRLSNDGAVEAGASAPSGHHMAPAMARACDQADVSWGSETSCFTNKHTTSLTSTREHQTVPGSWEPGKKASGDGSLLERTKEIFPTSSILPNDGCPCQLTLAAKVLEGYSMRAKDVLRILPKQASFSAAPLHALRHVLESLAAAWEQVGENTSNRGMLLAEQHCEQEEASHAAQDQEPHQASQHEQGQPLAIPPPPRAKEAEIFSEILAATPETKVSDRDKELLPRVLATFARYLNDVLASSTKQCTRDNYMRVFFKTFLQSGLSFEALAQPMLSRLLTQTEEHKRNHGNAATVVRNFSQFWRDLGGYDASFDEADRESMTLSMNIKPMLVDAYGVCGAGAHMGNLCQRPKQRCETCGTELRCPRHEEKHTPAECREIFWAKHSPSGKRTKTIADFWKAQTANSTLEQQ